jgi:hypothetical protein
MIAKRSQLAKLELTHLCYFADWQICAFALVHGSKLDR